MQYVMTVREVRIQCYKARLKRVRMGYRGKSNFVYRVRSVVELEDVVSIYEFRSTSPSYGNNRIS